MPHTHTAPPRPLKPPQGVNTTLYDPARYTPLDITAKAQLVFGRTWADKAGQQPPAPAAKGGSSGGTAAAGLVLPHANATASSTERALLASHGSENSSGSSGNETTSSTTMGQESEGDTGGQQREGGDTSAVVGSSGQRRPFRFISTFKWEERKGWSILLEAYLTAFTAEDDVE